MKLSVSLSESDVAVIDEFARDAGLPSRSAVIQYALRQLRSPELDDAYAEAWEEWDRSGEAAVWEAVTGDGFDRAAR